MDQIDVYAKNPGIIHYNWFIVIKLIALVLLFVFGWCETTFRLLLFYESTVAKYNVLNQLTIVWQIILYLAIIPT